MERARSVRLRADVVAREVRITVPRRMTLTEAMTFAHKHRDWLAQRMARALAPVPLCPGAEIGLLGEAVRIEWDAAYPRAIRQGEGAIRLGGPESAVGRRVLGWLKEEALAHMARDLADYCALLGQPVPRLSLGDARGRWGSCSRIAKGAGGDARAHVRMNWRLVMAPVRVRRSVVAHEVAHLLHMNHSPDFYALLDNLFEGDRPACDRWLRAHGAGLHMVGRDAPAQD